MLLLTIFLVGYSAWWLCDALYGPWLDMPALAEPEPARPKTYQVMPGDTIWDIYVQYYQGHDWAEVWYKVGQANGLKNDRLYPYEVITLPEVG